MRREPVDAGNSRGGRGGSGMTCLVLSNDRTKNDKMSDRILGCRSQEVIENKESKTSFSAVEPRELLIIRRLSKMSCFEIDHDKKSGGHQASSSSRAVNKSAVPSMKMGAEIVRMSLGRVELRTDR